MSEKKEKRIQSYKKFLKECNKAMVICGGILLSLAIIIFFSLQGTKYFYLCVGFGLVGCALMIKYIYLFYKQDKLQDNEMGSDFDARILRIKKKIKVYSFGLILGIMVSILIVIIKVRTDLLLSMIPIVIYSAVEYIASLLQLFRLNLLRQEVE